MVAMTLAVTPLTDLDALHAAFVAQQAVLTAERAELFRVSSVLAAERAEKERVIEQNDRLRQIIRQLQRMQFGKRSETVDPGQFTLALEELEQAVATVEAEQERREPAVKRAYPSARSSPRFAARPFAANRAGGRARGHGLPVLRGRDACHRRGSLRAPRRDPGAISGDRHPGVPNTPAGAARARWCRHRHRCG